MKTNLIQQEILLLTDSTFSQQLMGEKGSSDSDKYLSQTEQLENACWNGALYEMLPGVIKKTPGGKNLYVWEVRSYANFLEMELGEYLETTKQQDSINPYIFLSALYYN
ncbi:hypothetical protein FRZ67_18470 [Panacibacter ginsenosidivorans]|uniref:Uncharacterized protein n=1 Tax=Panacibacter ginsenosidivorans TaxID=1813871 RepID=A0A5B8VD53_9BACT|nr:hypothetical protein [Panacibacter ginsenosidivorans]QEC69199.1 hypothetical protein FRZ67_18470 [Panacibacter ginsenosidivorans]